MMPKCIFGVLGICCDGPWDGGRLDQANRAKCLGAKLSVIGRLTAILSLILVSRIQCGLKVKPQLKRK